VLLRSVERESKPVFCHEIRVLQPVTTARTARGRREEFSGRYSLLECLGRTGDRLIVSRLRQILECRSQMARRVVALSGGS
jgi:hypothetical protein